MVNANANPIDAESEISLSDLTESLKGDQTMKADHNAPCMVGSCVVFFGPRDD